MLYGFEVFRGVFHMRSISEIKKSNRFSNISENILIPFSIEIRKGGKFMLVKGDKRELLKAQQFFVDDEVGVIESEKILSVGVSAKITGEEMSAGEVGVKYKLAYKVLYIADGGIRVYETTSEHSTVLRDQIITTDCAIDLNLVVVATEFVGTTKLKIRTNLELCGFAVVPKSFDCYEGEDGVFIKETPVTIERIIPIASSQIVTTSTHQLKESVDKILTSDTGVVINKVTTATETCQIEGECFTYLTYLSGGIMQSRCLVTPFEAEILASGVGADDKAYCRAEVETSLVTQDASSTDLKTEIILNISGFAVVTETVTTVGDCYSKSKELKLNYGLLDWQDNVCIAGCTEKLQGSVRLPEGARLRSVLAVCAPLAGAVTVENKDALTVEGVFTATLIYLGEDESISSVPVSLPYRFILDRNFACRDSLSACASVLCVSARARLNDEAEVTAELVFEVYGASEKSVKYLGGAEVVGDKEVNDAAISLYIVGEGEGLWEVGKALSSDEDELMSLNPDLTLPLKPGDRVLLYRTI